MKTVESRNLSLLSCVEPLECLVRVRYRPVAYDSRCIGHLAPFGSDQLTGSDGIYLASEPHKKATLSPTIVRGISPLCIGQFPRSPTRPGLTIRWAVWLRKECVSVSRDATFRHFLPHRRAAARVDFGSFFPLTFPPSLPSQLPQHLTLQTSLSRLLTDVLLLKPVISTLLSTPAAYTAQILS